MTIRRFAVVGHPVAHSASPRMHAAAYAALGLECTYEALPTDEASLPSVVARLVSGELDGLNVTIPHKRRVLSLVGRVDDSARFVGAANTLVRGEGGSIVAYNTDAPALATELRALANLPTWNDGHGLVLGTGGAARAAVLALACSLGVAVVTVRGRALADRATQAQFEAEVAGLLRQAGAATTLRLEPWEAVRETDQAVDIVVQATSLGMAGAGDGQHAANVVDWSALPLHAVALDVVYASQTTPFVATATARGLRAADGRGMLARQGALAFELWLGRPAPFDAMLGAL